MSRRRRRLKFIIIVKWRRSVDEADMNINSVAALSFYVPTYVYIAPRAPYPTVLVRLRIIHERVPIIDVIQVKMNKGSLITSL